MYGPKGVGALYLRRRQPKVSIQPLFLGGGQEFDMRSGTLNVPGIVGLGKACELNKDQMGQWERVAVLRNRLENFFKQTFGSEILINGEMAERIPNTLNLSFKTKSVAPILRTLADSIAISQSSACSSGELEKSHSSTLVALGRSDFEIKNTLRMSLGLPTTAEEIEKIEEILLKALS
jgi:cysteine desulfurase